VSKEGVLSNSDRQAILVFYILACAWSWPFFWWQTAYQASWNAWHFPNELKEYFIQWGPGLAAIAVYYLFPRARPRFLSLAGSSWTRSLICFLVPILILCMVAAFHGDPRWTRGPYYLLAAGFSCLGEELGWRGFLQGALQPFGKIRGSLLVALMWTVWHFNPTWDGLISHLEVLLPVTVAVSVVLTFATGRSGSVLLAAAVHEWLDIGTGYDDYRRWVALAAVPLWLWMVSTWPKRAPSTFDDAHIRFHTG
jgi:membrane protease YdiL (CAAX protease family)